MKAPPSRINQKRSETNDIKTKTSDRPEIPVIPLRESDRMLMARIAAKGPAVSLQFFDRMTRAATEVMGPMAHRILGDQISALGESRNAFPQVKLAELIHRVSGEILNDTMRARFQNIMLREIAALKTMSAI